MSDEADAAEAAWDEMGRPSLAELERRENMVFSGGGVYNHAKDKIYERIYAFDPEGKTWTATLTNVEGVLYYDSEATEVTSRHPVHRLPTVGDWLNKVKATQQNAIQEEQVTTKQELLRQAEATKASLERLQDKIAKLARFPDEDPLVDGQVLYFQKKYPGTDTKYTYVALRHDNQYYLTGLRQAERTYTWESLVEFMAQGSGLEEVWLMERTRSLLDGDSAATPNES